MMKCPDQSGPADLEIGRDPVNAQVTGKMSHHVIISKGRQTRVSVIGGDRSVFSENMPPGDPQQMGKTCFAHGEVFLTAVVVKTEHIKEQQYLIFIFGGKRVQTIRGTGCEKFLCGTPFEIDVKDFKPGFLFKNIFVPDAAGMKRVSFFPAV